MPATLTLPESARAGVIVLHGAEAGDRSYFLYEHLAALLVEHSVAVLRYDRRAANHGHDVPLHMQAADALTAANRLRDFIGAAVPVGLWGFSQGAWAASLAAVSDPGAVNFVISVSSSGVSPAVQMRVGCAMQLRKHGYSQRDVEDLTTTRLAVERYLRTGDGRQAAQSSLDHAAAQPWFSHSYLSRALAEPGSWHDMDFDPKPILDSMSCRALAFYGETDDWIPLEASIEAWRHAEKHGSLSDLTLVRLPGTGHLPTIDSVPDVAAVSESYSGTLAGWMQSIVSGR